MEKLLVIFKFELVVMKGNSSETTDKCNQLFIFISLKWTKWTETHVK